MRSPKPIILIVLAVCAALTATTRLVEADPIGAPTLSSTNVQVGGTTTVTAHWGPDEAGDAKLMASGPGSFVSAAVVTNTDSEGVIESGDKVVTVHDDPDAVNDPLTSLQATFECDAEGIVTFVLQHNGVASAPSAELHCTSVTVDVTATPNLLQCGGKSTIKAELRDEDGKVIPGKDFHFVIVANDGTISDDDESAALLEKKTATTAEVTLMPGTDFAKVRASVGGLSGEVVVQNSCSNATEGEVVAVAVTADPSTIDCGGSSKLTATARDNAGRVVEGVGYHFSVAEGQGKLSGPQDAGTIANVALLTMQPGMESTTVVVRVGTVEGSVVVRQHCLGVTTDKTTAVGSIWLTSPSSKMRCGETTFIGARVRDFKNEVVPDGTEVRFVSPYGEFDSSDGRTTVNGALNVRFTAGAFNGDAVITAAAGDAFGTIHMQISCSGGASTGGTTTGGGSPSLSVSGGGGTSSAPAAPRCIPIGDNRCITPPSTGSAGLKQ